MIEMNKFYERRDELIDAMEAGEVDKITYLEESLGFFEEMHFRPKATERLNFEEAVIHYQYYNLKAKAALMAAETHGEVSPSKIRQFENQAADYYMKKDQVSMHLVALVNYEHVKAYYIQMQSKRLEGELYEVIFENEHRLILHSKDKRLLNRLIQAGVFSQTLQPSAIEEYINTRYK